MKSECLAVFVNGAAKAQWCRKTCASVLGIDRDGEVAAIEKLETIGKVSLNCRALASTGCGRYKN